MVIAHEAPVTGGFAAELSAAIQVKTVLLFLLVTTVLYYAPPPLAARGEHLGLLWFPVTQMCVSVRLCLSASASASVPDFVYTIFPTVFRQWHSNS